MADALPRFEVRNLGPIAHGTVELRPLTILIGKNNTGKTYMAQTIYAAYKALQRANGSADPILTLSESLELLSRLRDADSTAAAELFKPIETKITTWLHDRLAGVGASLSDRLEVYFDIEGIGELTRWGAQPAALDVAVSTRAFSTTPSTLFSLAPNNDPPAAVLQGMNLDFDDLAHYPLLDMFNELVAGDTRDDQQKERLQRQLSYMLTDMVWYGHLLPVTGLAGAVHYLPAGRSGLLEAWTDVVRMRLEQEREGLALHGSDPPALGGIALDFLIELQRLTSPTHRRARFNPFAPRRPRAIASQTAVAHLETLISGSIVSDRGRERVPSLVYQQGRRTIPVQRASSMVAELAPLLSWISHLIQPGDLLLIDEPEAHMHPEAVTAVAEALVALTQSGVNVLCTTHSTEFLHQVSNCMLRAAAAQPPDPRAYPSIATDNLRVYRFEHRDEHKGTIVVPIDIDPHWGIPEDEYVAVADRLSAETSQLIRDLP